MPTLNNYSAARRLNVGPRASERNVIITPAQCRSGRKLLRWSFDALAQKVKLTELHIARFEAGKPGILFMEAAMIRRALEQGGVEFNPKSLSVRRRDQV